MGKLIDRLLGKKSPERTVVYLRTYDITPAKFMESEVYYDAWGSPYVCGDVYGDAFHDAWMTNTLEPKGQTGSCWLQWKHKSGPAVTFPNTSEPDLGWFPRRT